MKKFVRKFISNLLFLIYRNKIVKKKIRHSELWISYPLVQHLNFFLKKEVEYEQEIQNKIKDKIKKASLIFDIGANIGQYMLFFSQISKRSTKIISVEPNKDCFKILKLNVELNQLSNITLLNNAVGENNKEVLLGVDKETGGRMSSTKNLHMFDYKQRVSQVSLLSMIEKFGKPDFIKVDTEGGESSIFNEKNYSYILDTVVLVEVRGETKENIFNIFKKHSCFCIETNSEIYSYNEIPDFADLIFTPKFKA